MNTIEKFGMATFACIFNKDFSKVLLIKRNEEKRKKFGFDLAIIGGKIELGEHSHEALMREIEEEIGVKIPLEDLSLLYVKEDPHWFDIAHVAFFMYGAVLDEAAKIILNDEAEEFAWFDMDNLPENRSDDDIHKMRDYAIKLFSKE